MKTDDRDLRDESSTAEVPRGPAVPEVVADRAKLTRVASAMRMVLNEARELQLSEPARARMWRMYQRVVDDLATVLPAELRHEMTVLRLPPAYAEAVPTSVELRIAFAQLLGWLEGVIAGMQRSNPTAPRAPALTMKKNGLPADTAPLDTVVADDARDHHPHAGEAHRADADAVRLAITTTIRR